MRSGNLKAFICVTIWGGSFVATRYLVDNCGMDPLNLITIRALGSVLLLWPSLKLTREWTGVARGRLLRDLAVLGFIFALHLTLQALALTMTTAGNTAWMTSLAPVFIALLAWRFLGERFGARKIAGFALAMGGALLVTIAQAGGLEGLALPGTTGDFIAFSTSITWAVYSVLSKPVAQEKSPAMLMFHVLALGGLMSTPVFVARQGWQDFACLDAIGWLALGFLTILVSVVAQSLWYGALSELDASQVGVFLYIEPPLAVIVGAALLDEVILPLSLVGGAAIIVGVWLVTVNRARQTA